MTQVLVILGSSRSHGYTRRALDQIFKSTPHVLVNLNDKNISPYDYDQKNINDDHKEIITRMIEADSVVFATPVYWYAMSAQMKIFFDRFSDLLTTHAHMRQQLGKKNCYLLATGTDAELPDGFEVPFKKTCEYLGMKYRMALYIGKTSIADCESLAEPLLQDICCHGSSS
jgi:multimeric flavodoxin WrbA